MREMLTTFGSAVRGVHLKVPTLKGLYMRSWKLLHTSYFGHGALIYSGVEFFIFGGLFALSVAGFFVHFEEI